MNIIHSCLTMVGGKVILKLKDELLDNGRGESYT